MPRLFAFLLLILALFIFSTRRALPFSITNDIVFESDFKKRSDVKPNHNIFTSLVRYSSESARLLNSVNKANLIGFRCSDNLIRTDQGVYILRNVKTDQNQKRRITNTNLVEFMRNKEKSITSGKKILTARICELEDKTLLIFYSTGVYDIKSAESSPIYQTIYNSDHNDAYIQIFSQERIFGSRTYTIAKSQGHLICDDPFQITTTGILYLLCDEELEKSSNHFIYEMDLNIGSSKLFKKCLNNFVDTLKIKCD